MGWIQLHHLLVRSLIRSHRSLIFLLRTARFAHALRCAHLFVRSHIRSHRSLIQLLRTACFACALRCAHSFAKSLTPELMGNLK